MKNPTISVIIPVYNAMPYLKQAINSVINQTHKAHEIIVIDDASTDGSAILLREYEARHKSVKVYNLPPKIGNERRVAVALNKGLDLATGEYIALMDADDWCELNRFEKQIAFLEEHKDVDACGSWAYMYREDKKWTLKKSLNRLYENPDKMKLYLLRQSPFLQNAVMMRRDLIEKYSLRYNESFFYAEDYEFFIRLSEHATLANIPEPLVNYRIHKKQSIQQPDFIEYVKKITLSQLHKYFQVQDYEAQLYWQLMNHRQDYAVADLPKIFEWMQHLIQINQQQNIFNSQLFVEFINDSWSRKITSRKKYSIGLLKYLLSHPEYLKNIPNKRLAIFAAKCIIGYKF